MVNLAFYTNALAMADRQFAQGKGIIDKQHRLIARLDACGIDSTIANTLLVTFLTSQQQHEDDRDRFSSEIAKFGGNERPVVKMVRT